MRAELRAISVRYSELSWKNSDEKNFVVELKIFRWQQFRRKMSRKKCFMNDDGLTRRERLQQQPVGPYLFVYLA